MAYDVRLSPHAARAYQKLDGATKAQIQPAIDALRRHPLAGPKIKRLKGRLRAYYRYRAGDHRIVYTIGQHEHVVYVDYIQHRKDVYRGA